MLGGILSGGNIGGIVGGMFGGPVGAMIGNALGGALLNVGDQLLQKVGEQLGLPQSAIDAAQGMFHSAAGNVEGAAQNYREAYEGLLGQLNPMEQAQIGQEVEQGIGKIIDLIGNLIQENGSGEAGKGKGKEGGANFLEALALALGEVLGDKADKMMKSLDDLQKAGEGEEFSKAQAKFSADSQNYSMMSNLTNTVLKSVGESMNTLARKQ